MSLAQVSISLGSNQDREVHLREAVRRLKQVFGELRLSPVYETAAVGFDGDDFYNLVAVLHSSLLPREVASALKKIEDDMGRDRSQPRFSARGIDLDILTYDEVVLDQDGVQIPRHEILKNSFVLKPMADVMPEQKHPLEGRSYSELWIEMAGQCGRITAVDLDLEVDPD